MLNVDATVGLGAVDAISAPISGWRSHRVLSTPLKSLGESVSRSRGKATGRPERFIRGFLNCLVLVDEVRKGFEGEGDGEEEDRSELKSTSSSLAFRLRPLILT